MINYIIMRRQKKERCPVNSIEISIQDIFWSLKKYIVWIILATLIGALGAYSYTSLFVTPVYSARVSFCVFAKDRDGADVSNSELTADANIAKTYSILLTSQPVKEAVSDAMDGRVSAGTIGGMLSTTNPTNTQVIYVTIRSTDPQLAVAVGNTLLEVAPEVLSDIARGGDMTAVDSATSAGQVSPNLSANVTYGLLIGLLISCAVVVIIAVLDTTIWREEDLERALSIPVLGSIPSMFTEAQTAKRRKGK